MTAFVHQMIKCKLFSLNWHKYISKREGVLALSQLSQHGHTVNALQQRFPKVGIKLGTSRKVIRHWAGVPK